MFWHDALRGPDSGTNGVVFEEPLTKCLHPIHPTIHLPHNTNNKICVHIFFIIFTLLIYFYYFHSSLYFYIKIKAESPKM